MLGVHSPFSLLSSIDRVSRQLHGRSLSPRASASRRLAYPQIHMDESEESYTLTADLPGLTTDDLELSVQGTQLNLSIRSPQPEDSEGVSVYNERKRLVLKQNFRFPVRLDEAKVDAQLKNGVLRIQLPKQSPSIHRITITD